MGIIEHFANLTDLAYVPKWELLLGDTLLVFLGFFSLFMCIKYWRLKKHYSEEKRIENSGNESTDC